MLDFDSNYTIFKYYLNYGNCYNDYGVKTKWV
jgi:hypothetical protein